MRVTGLAERPASGGSSYAAFGLGIESGIPLPELLPSSGAPCPDVVIRRLHPLGQRPLRVAADFSTLPHSARLDWPGIGSFAVTPDAIHLRPEEGLDEALCAFPLLGPVIATCLHLRGRFVLHGSALALGGAGIVLLGDKGAGKSTTAHAMLAAGARLVADDIAAVTHEGEPQVLPAFPQTKIDPALQDLYPLPGARFRPAIDGETGKRRLLVPAFRSEPLRLAAIYVLGRDPGFSPFHRVEPVAGALSLPLLLRFAYMARYPGAASLGAPGRAFLAAAARIAAQVPLRRLVLAPGLDRLAGVAALVEEDLAARAAIAA